MGSGGSGCVYRSNDGRVFQAPAARHRRNSWSCYASCPCQSWQIFGWIAERFVQEDQKSFLISLRLRARPHNDWLGDSVDMKADEENAKSEDTAKTTETSVQALLVGIPGRQIERFEKGLTIERLFYGDDLHGCLLDSSCCCSTDAPLGAAVDETRAVGFAGHTAAVGAKDSDIPRAAGLDTFLVVPFEGLADLAGTNFALAKSALGDPWAAAEWAPSLDSSRTIAAAIEEVPWMDLSGAVDAAAAAA